MRRITKILLSLLMIAVVVEFAHAGVTMHWAQAEDLGGNTPTGYFSWDLMATTTTNLAMQELIVSTGVLGDIYQNTGSGSALYTEPNPANFGSVPALEFDTYVTFSAWPYPTPTMVFGGATDIIPGSVLTFNTQNLNVSWIPMFGNNTGPGTFQVARVTLKDTADGTWQFRGWQTGGIDAALFGGSIVDGVPLPEPATLSLLLLGSLTLLRRRSS